MTKPSPPFTSEQNVSSDGESASGGSSDVNKCYLVSSNFDYEKTICSDNGPDYANHMGWTSAGLNESEAVVQDYPIVLVDTRFNESECNKLATLVDNNPETLFGFSVVDPGAEQKGLPYPQLLFDVKDKSNVFYLSRYEPKGTAQHLVELTTQDKLVVVPYAFVDPTYPISNHPARDARIFFSGSLNINTYPYRQTFSRLRRWVPFFTLFIERLEHPGYPDTGGPPTHDIIGDRYIEHLSAYRHMLLTPSKYKVELLKYRECAMAGCVPVGIPPDGFPDDMLHPFVDLPLESAFRSTLRLPEVFWMGADEAKERAQAYRDAYRKHRDPQLLNKKLDAFLAETGRV